MGKHRAERKRMPWWQETFLLVGLALAASIVVKAFFVQMFFVPSASMRPQLVEDDRILVEKMSHWDSRVDRGDVVVFKDPGGWLGTTPEPTGFQQLLALLGLYPEGGHLVKRVIAVGGDRVVCCDRRGRIKVNGRPLRERDYLGRDTAPSTKQFAVRVPDDAIWVMGDNRSNSEDSRYHQDQPGRGTVPEENVVGRVWAIVWPLDRVEVLNSPETFETLPPPESD
jgi:signal peptidase I